MTRFRIFSATCLLSFGTLAGSGCGKRESDRSRSEVPVTTNAAVTGREGPCEDGSEWRQRHGTSCLCCHQEFGVGGSVIHDAGVAVVRITDARGHELEIAPNPFDNFFRHAKMQPPLVQRLRRRERTPPRRTLKLPAAATERRSAER